MKQDIHSPDRCVFHVIAASAVSLLLLLRLWLEMILLLPPLLIPLRILVLSGIGTWWLFLYISGHVNLLNTNNIYIHIYVNFKWAPYQTQPNIYTYICELLFTVVNLIFHTKLYSHKMEFSFVSSFLFSLSPSPFSLFLFFFLLLYHNILHSLLYFILVFFVSSSFSFFGYLRRLSTKKIKSDCSGEARHDSMSPPSV